MEIVELSAIRREYSLQELSENSVTGDPFEQFSTWMNDALNADLIEPTAMTVSTADADGRPSARVVLLKAVDKGSFIFYTNYESKKATDIAANPSVSLHFFWPDLERQMIITGRAEKTTREESEVYFASRPAASRIGAWASHQSSELNSRKELEDRVAEMHERFEEDEIPCPPFWGGFRVTPDRFEFWQGRKSRLHDRIVYKWVDNAWTVVRLSP